MPMLRAIAATALLAALGCGDDDDRRPTTPADQTYTVEGRVERLPREGAAIREVSIAHEAIPEFQSREGERVGMEAMSMQFELAPSVSLDGIEPSDRVRFTFEVRWNARPMLYVTRLTAL